MYEYAAELPESHFKYAITHDLNNNELAKEWNMDYHTVSKIIEKERALSFELKTTSIEKLRELVNQSDSSINILSRLFKTAPRLIRSKIADEYIDINIVEKELLNGKYDNEIADMLNIPFLTGQRLVTYRNKHGIKVPRSVVMKRREATNLIKYGNKVPMKTDIVKNNLKKSMMDKYGVENISSLDGMKKLKSDKMKKTLHDKMNILWHETEYFSVKKDAYELLFDAEAMVNFVHNEMNKDKVSYLELAEALGFSYRTVAVHYGEFLKNTGIIKLVGGSSYMEDELLDVIKENYSGEIVRHNRTILENYEMDIYLPELKLAFEFNGTFWHSTEKKGKMFHEEKVRRAHNKGIDIMLVWEDEWANKKDIIVSMIKYKLGVTDKTYFARKLTTKEITSHEAIEFYEINHIQGGRGITGTSYGLFDSDNLISVMTFNKTWRSKEYYELTRFATKLNTNVVGGASKLFSKFSKKHIGETVISYANGNFAKGSNSVYRKLGFEYEKRTEPMYYWVNDKNDRLSRYQTQPKKLLNKYPDDFRSTNKNETEREFMERKGYYQIYTPGNDRYVKVIK